MTRKDLVEEIKQNMPDGLTQLEKARYIYLELGKQRRFDTRYYYGNSKTRKRIKMLAMNARYNAKKYYNEKNLVCISLSYLYQSILREYGINCVVTDNDMYSSGHVMPILYIDDEKRGKLKIKADLQRDLPWIQAGMITDNFGDRDDPNEGFTELYYEDLREIDRKIGYIDDEYKDVELQQLAHEIKNMNVHESLRYVLKDPRIIQRTDFKGHVEAREYYGHILKTLLKKYNRRKAYIFTCYRDKEINNEDEQKQKQREYTICAFSYEKDECIPYLYSVREKKFKEVSVDTLIELQESGLVFGTSTKTPGAGLIKKIINKRKKEKLKNEQQNQR